LISQYRIRNWAVTCLRNQFVDAIFGFFREKTTLKNSGSAVQSASISKTDLSQFRGCVGKA